MPIASSLRPRRVRYRNNRTFKRIHQEALHNPRCTYTFPTALDSVDDSFRRHICQLVAQRLPIWSVHDTKLDIPWEDGSHLDAIRGGVGPWITSVVGAGTVMSERAEGRAEGVDEGLAGGIDNHIGRCKEARGGSNDALNAYNKSVVDIHIYGDEMPTILPSRRIFILSYVARTIEMRPITSV
jgi:hypothetical protein